ncbi:nucleotidyltransferase domain-containing protein, partial [Candidatus Amesbacteria bacterium]|nr:nucleotidyltransferase domain-containing protein [Candidatus Amesbacteria bacterium]
MRDLILNRLKQIEVEEKVSILYACESGSRAWGFPSRDSDYDVRFIYIHPIDWYLSIFPKSDVIELPLQNSLDFSGWDLKKALQLFAKSNPPLYEWLGSPIVYFESGQIVQEMRRLSPI